MNELTLADVLKFAKASDLKNTPIIDDYSNLCQIVNLVLIELHSRFTLTQNIVEVPLEQDKTTYNLLDYISKKD